MIDYQSASLQWHFYTGKRFNGTALITVLISLTEKHCWSQCCFTSTFLSQSSHLCVLLQRGRKTKRTSVVLSHNKYACHSAIKQHVKLIKDNTQHGN